MGGWGLGWEEEREWRRRRRRMMTGFG